MLPADGVDPATVLVLRHAGSSTDALKATVGAAAKLAVRENDQGGPTFALWQPFTRPDLEGAGTLLPEAVG